MAIIKLNRKKPECCEDCEYAGWDIDTDTCHCRIRYDLFDEFIEYGNSSKCHKHCPLEDEEDDT